MAAWTIGILGAVLSEAFGAFKLGFPFSQILLWIVASNFVGMAGALITLRLEKIHWVKSRILPGRWQTWGCLLILYFGGLFLFAPPLLDSRVFAWMVLPLIMSTGLMLNPFFGPIQDWLVRSSQRSSRARCQRLDKVKLKEGA